MALWDGRFSRGPAEEMMAFSESLGTDLLMWEEDILGSVAHATMLGEVGVLSAEEAAHIVAGLGRVASDLRDGWRPGPEAEDIHMAVEGRLHEHIGPLAGKLHTARSRNDQVATDVRLWVRKHLGLLDAQLQRLIRALLDRTERDGRRLVAGYTHLQRAQPVWLGHIWLAHAWALSRDRERVAGALDRNNRSPLGAAALAGTPHPIDRHRSAELLGFPRLVDNAMDAVSARDHLIEAVSAAAMIAVHLSRMAEELVVGSSAEFGLYRLSEAWSTGSSIMPQKRNPDAAELVRGKTGRVLGDLTALLTLVKGLPLAYNRDLQEDRPPLFDALNTTTACVSVLAGCFESLEVVRTPDLRGDPLLATEIADHLATLGVPFREGHRVAGQLVRQAEERGVRLDELSLEELRAAHPALGPDLYPWLDPVAAVERRRSAGGTAWVEVERQVAALRTSLSDRS